MPAEMHILPGTSLWITKYRETKNPRHEEMRVLASQGKTEEEAREIVLNRLWNALTSATKLPHQSTAAYRALDEYCDFLHYGN